MSEPSKWQHDPRGLSIEDFHGINKDRWERSKIPYIRNTEIGAYTSAHRVVARYAMLGSSLIRTDDGRVIIPRDVVEEVVELLELGHKLPIFGAGPAVKEALYDVLDSSEPGPRPTTEVDALPEQEAH